MRLSGGKRARVKAINLILLIILLVFSVYFVMAAISVTTSSGSAFSPTEDVNYIYNISVNNSGASEVENVSKVNVTIPASFAFSDASNSTNSFQVTFTNTSVYLVWENSSGLIPINTTSWFKFNATAPTPGAYTFSVVTTNSSTSNTTTLSFNVNDTTVPDSINFVSPSPSTKANLSQLFITVNVTATDNGAIDRILLRLHNSTQQVTNTTTSTSSPLYVNITGLSDGIYYINATINDTYNNQNSTLSTLNITLDTTNPLVSYGLLTESNNINKSQSWIYVNVSVTETNEQNITFTLYNSTGSFNITNFTDKTRTINWTGLSDGNYTYNVTVKDYATNSNTTSTRTITLDTTNPLVSYGLLTESNNINKSQSWIYVNVTITETNQRNITFVLYNFTASVNITNFTDSTKTINWTGLSDGNYTYNVTVKDYATNSNTTSTRTITLDTTIPFIGFGASGNADNDSSVERDWIYANVSITEVNQRNITFYLYDATSSINVTNFTDSTRTINWTGLSRVAYFYNVTVRDFADNSNTSNTRKITLTSPAAASSAATSSSGGGSNSANPWNKGTFAIRDEQLQEGYTKKLIAKQRLSVNIGGSHYIGVKEVTSSSAKIEVASVPQEKIMSAGEEWKVEVTNDNFYDLLIKANSINEGIVDLLVKSIHEVVPGNAVVEEPQQEETIEEQPTITGEAIEGAGGELSWLWILLVVLVLIILAIVLIKKKK